MLKIMYGFLLNDLPLNKLIGASYQGHGILNVKNMTQFENGSVFSALVDDDLTLYNQKFHSLDNTVLLNVSFKTPLPRKPTKLRADIVDSKEANRHRKKYVRRLNNLSLNIKNWRQFVGARNTVVTSVTRKLSVI